MLKDAEAAGSIRPGLRHSPIAGMVLEAIMFNAFSSTIGGTSIRAVDPDPAEELWEFILHGVGTGPPTTVVEPTVGPFRSERDTAPVPTAAPTAGGATAHPVASSRRTTKLAGLEEHEVGE